MTELVFYHNPKCSKSRQAKALLDENNINYRLNDYMKTGLAINEVSSLLDLLGITPDQFIRQSTLKQLGLSISDLSSDDIVKLICDHPGLFERPVLSNGTVSYTHLRAHET